MHARDIFTLLLFFTAALQLPALPLLTSAQQIRRLTADQAQLHYPIRLDAVVTYHDPASNGLFVQDATAGIFITTKDKTLEIGAGQHVIVTGTSGPGKFAPVVLEPHFKVMGKAPLPVARRVSFEQMSSGTLDAQWVEIEGIVRSAVLDKGRGEMEVGTLEGVVKVRLTGGSLSALERLVDSKVRIRGACSSSFNARRQLLHFQLRTPAMSEIVLVEPGPSNAFAIPLQPADALLQFNTVASSGHRIRVRGTVTFQKPGRSLYIKDATQSLYIQTRQHTTAQPGDVVDVLGFPAAGEAAPMLQEAIFRRVGPGRPAIAATIVPKDALAGAYESELVRVKARLLNRVRRQNEQVLVLQAGALIFNAFLDEPDKADRLARLRDGSLVSLTGICSSQGPGGRLIGSESFRLILRSPDDVTVLEQPSWWTWSHTLWTLSAMGSVILAALAWVLFLRLRVRKQTAIIREKLEHEAALEQRYRDLFENARDMVFTVDLQGNITSLNQAGERITGYALSEALRLNLREIVTGSAGEPIGPVLERLMSGGAQALCELEIVSKDGRAVMLEINPRMILVDGRPAAVEGIARDVTERKLREDQARRQQELWQLVLRGNNDGFWDWNAATDETYHSPRWMEIIGFEPHEIERGHQEWELRIHPEDLARVKRELHNYLNKTSAAYVIDYRMQCRDGSYVWVLARGQAVWDKEGKPIRMVGSHSDISQRKKAEEEMQASQERYKQLFDYNPLPACVYDVETLTFLAVNEAAVEHYGYSRDEFLSLKITALDSGPDVSGLPTDPSAGKQDPGRRRHKKKDGTSILVELNAHDVTFQGQVRRLVLVRDVTERQQVEATLLQYAKDLEEAKQAAEQASKAKSQFLATMSHEIRTPMNGVIGMTNLLLDLGLTAQQREFAETIRGSADSLLTIINDILDFSKIEAGKMTVEPIPFDLEVALEEVVDLLATVANDRGLDLLLDYPEQAPRLLVGDAGRIRQVILNLAGNALKFTQKGQVTIVVRRLEETAVDVLLKVEVRDTGEGIPEHARQMLFEKFTQADASTKRKFGGTGLGLAISRQLAELMGGRLGLDSTVGEGSSFWMELRLPIDRNQGQRALHGHTLEGARILVAGSPGARSRILQDHLLGWKMRPDIAASSLEALDLLRLGCLRGDPFRIAIIDSGRPGDSAPDLPAESLAKVVKADLQLRETMLVLLAAAPQKNDSVRLAPAGWDACLSNPVRSSTLHNTLAAVLDKSCGRQPPPKTRQPAPDAAAATGNSMTTSLLNLNYRVLLAEDNIVNQKIASALLKKYGCRMDLAATGREAVDMWEKLPYNLIFMDCQMPVMDGFEATAEIRRREAGQSRIPIIAMTANVMQGDREECLAAGMDDYISKPVNTKALQSALLRWGEARTENGASCPWRPNVKSL